MPILKDSREVVEVEMLAVKGGKISAYKGLLAGDMEKIMFGSKEGQQTSVITTLLLLIKDWNLENEKGEKLPVSEENIRLLDFRDVNKIIKTIGLDKSDFLEQAGK